MSRDAEFEPCTLVEHESGQFSLTFDDLDDYAEIFEDQGWEGNGYAWEGVVQTVLSERSPELLEELEFDSEAGMFAVYATDLDPLREVAGVIREAVVDLDMLAEAIERAAGQGLLD
jgi:hypothetical protein